jgi:hypothetical protein
MFADLKRCVRCHRRYPGPLGHRCPLTFLHARREEDFEQGFCAWLDSNEGRFACTSRGGGGPAQRDGCRFSPSIPPPGDLRSVESGPDAHPAGWEVGCSRGSLRPCCSTET